MIAEEFVVAKSQPGSTPSPALDMLGVTLSASE